MTECDDKHSSTNPRPTNKMTNISFLRMAIPETFQSVEYERSL
jgi:hypothetical protein